MIGKLFIATAAIGLLVNLYGDWGTLQQSKSAISSGDWVAHSYQVTKALDSTKIGILESLLTQSVSRQLHDDIDRLTGLVQDFPLQSVRAQGLKALSDRELLRVPKLNPALSILSEMSAAEGALLQMRLTADEEINRIAVEKVLVCNAMDVLLIFLFIGIYFYDRRSSLKLQASLANSLMDVEAGSQRLRAALTRRTAKVKSTVHDLKNPLGSIRGFAELLHDEPSNQDSVVEMSSMIQKISNNTLSLVGMLLDEEVEARPKEPIHIAECVRETCRYLEPVALEKKQKIVVDKNFQEGSFLGSQRQLQDILFNVIGNALKFSPKGSMVTVEGDVREGFHEIRVKDKGPGFSENDFTKLFVPGEKLSAKPTGDEVSTGLGLYSVKQSVESFGGSVQVTNNADGGACVAIRLPLRSE